MYIKKLFSISCLIFWGILFGKFNTIKSESRIIGKMDLELYICLFSLTRRSQINISGI